MMVKGSLKRRIRSNPKIWLVKITYLVVVSMIVGLLIGFLTEAIFSPRTFSLKYFSAKLKAKGILNPHGLEFQYANNCSFYSITPNASFDYCGYLIPLPPSRITFNSLGFRDKEFIRKAPGVFRIVAIGDSFTFGEGVNLEDSYTKLLEHMLNQESNLKKYEVMNFGLPGLDTTKEVEIFFTHGLHYEPDLVLVGFVNNDDVNQTRIDQIKLKIRKDSDEDNLADYITALSIYEEEEATKSFEDRWKSYVEKPLGELHKIATEKRFAVMIVMLLGTGEQFEAMGETIERLDFSLVDVDLNRLQKEVPYPLSYPFPDSHPNARGHQTIAEVVHKKIRKHYISEEQTIVLT